MTATRLVPLMQPKPSRFPRRSLRMRPFQIAVAAVLSLSLAACHKARTFEALPDDMDMGYKAA